MEQKRAMNHFVRDAPEEVIMTVQDNKTINQAKATEKPLDPASLDFIDRISYFERFNPKAADNDNKNVPASAKGSDCFNAWAMPDFSHG